MRKFNEGGRGNKGIKRGNSDTDGLRSESSNTEVIIVYSVL